MRQIREISNNLKKIFGGSVFNSTTLSALTTSQLFRFESKPMHDNFQRGNEFLRYSMKTKKLRIMALGCLVHLEDSDMVIKKVINFPSNLKHAFLAFKCAKTYFECMTAIQQGNYGLSIFL